MNSYLERLDSGRLVWTFPMSNTREAPRAFVPDTPEEARLVQLRQKLERYEVVSYRTARELLNVQKRALSDLLAAGRLRKKNTEHGWMITSESLREWLGSGVARNLSKFRRF